MDQSRNQVRKPSAVSAPSQRNAQVGLPNQLRIVSQQPRIDPLLGPAQRKVAGSSATRQVQLTGAPSILSTDPGLSALRAASLGRVSELTHCDIASNVSPETLELYAHRVVAMGAQGDIISAAYSQILDDLRNAPVVDDWDRKLQQEYTRKCQCKVRVQVVVTKDDLAAFEKEENLTGLFEQAIDAGARRGLYESDISRGKATSPVSGGRGGGEFKGFPVHPPGLDVDSASRSTKQSIRVTNGEHKELNPPRFCFTIVIRYSCNCVLKVWYNRELEQFLPLATFPIPTLTPVLNPGTGQVSQMQLVSADGRTYQDDSSEDVQTRLVSDSSPAEKTRRGGGACTLMWVDCPSMPGPDQPSQGQNRWRWLVVAEASAAGCAPAYHMATIEFQPGDAKPSVKKEWDL